MFHPVALLTGLPPVVAKNIVAEIEGHFIHVEPP